MLMSLLIAFSLSGVEPRVVTTATEATLDAFMASLPPSKKPVEVGLIPDLQKSLEAQNPGRQNDIQRLTSSLRLCLETTNQKYVIELVRSTARPLGDVKLKRLTEFYKSEDAAVFDQLAKRNPSSFSTADKSNWQRILATYPLEEYRNASAKMFGDAARPGGYIETMAKCDGAFNAEVARQGLKTLDQ